MAKFNWREVGAGLIVPLILIALWQAAASLGWVNPHVLPSPIAVVQRWVAYLLPQVPYAEATGSWLAWAPPPDASTSASPRTALSRL